MHTKIGIKLHNKGGKHGKIGIDICKIRSHSVAIFLLAYVDGARSLMCSSRTYCSFHAESPK